MTDINRQKRPALAPRRASGTTTRSDRGATPGPPLPLSERLNRSDNDNSAEQSSQRSPSFSGMQGMSKMTRSSSSNPPPASLDSIDSSRPQSIRSISGSVGTATVAGTTTSTATPLVTPADDLLDPLLANSKRSLSSSPLYFEGSSAISGPIEISAQHQHRDTATDSEDHRMGVKQRRSDLAGGATSLSTKETRPATKAWNNTNPSLRWIDTSSIPSSSPLSTPAATSQVGGKAASKDIMSSDLESLTHSMNINDTPRTTILRQNEAENVEQSGQQQGQYTSYQNHPRHPTHQQQPFTQHDSFPPQAQYYTPIEPLQSPGLYPASFQQSPTSALGSMDPTAFETFRSTPDPYAPMYGMPGPASVSSSSSPQSPRYSHHGHQGSDSSTFMCHNTYPQVMPNMPTNLAHQSMMGPPSRTGPMVAPSGLVSASASSHNAMVMQGMSPFPPQSPMLMSMAPSAMDRITRRDSLSYQQSPVAIPGGPYNLGNQWSSSPPGPSGAGYSMHSHTPSWPAGFDYRSSSGIGHQRILSGHQPFLPPTMSFMPGSMSPPSSFIRPSGSSSGGRMGGHSRTPSSFSQFSQQRSPQADIQRSPLLEEFRSRHNNSRRFELQDIRGYIVEFSSDQHGSRFTQEKLDTASDEDRKMVFDELLPSALSLMTDVFGNYVIQKLIEHGTPEMRLQFMDRMQGHILSLSLGTYGCRVVQKALEHLGNADQMRIPDELRRDVLTCIKDQNANHVIQKILECISPSTQVDFIPLTFRNNVYNLAAHCYSCRVLQRIFKHCEDSQRRPLIDEMLRESEKLMHDQYGNYVIQWILQNGSKPDRDVVINKAKGNVMVLSRHKFASNVVEQIIRAASPEERTALIEEIMTPLQQEASIPGEEAVVGAVMMMKDQYGNYVLQRFLEMSRGQQRARLIALVKPALQSMKQSSSGYAKHLAAIERLLEAGSPRGSNIISTGELASTN